MNLSLSCVAAYSALALALVMTAQGQTSLNVVCTPKDHGVYTLPSNRIHVNCGTSIRAGNDNVKYFQYPLSPDSAGAQFLYLLTQAKIQKRSVIIGFYADRSRNDPGCNVVDCRKMNAMLLL